MNVLTVTYNNRRCPLTSCEASPVAHRADEPWRSGKPRTARVLCFANPMGSDNDVNRRPGSNVLSVAERHFAELSNGVFDVTITPDGAEVTREKLVR